MLIHKISENTYASNVFICKKCGQLTKLSNSKSRKFCSGRNNRKNSFTSVICSKCRYTYYIDDIELFICRKTTYERLLKVWPKGTIILKS